VLIGLVLALLIPLSLRVGREWIVTGDYRTIRAGLLLVDVVLLAMLAVTIWLVKRLTRRIDQLTARDPPQGGPNPPD
jgi:hypothetical protein